MDWQKKLKKNYIIFDKLLKQKIMFINKAIREKIDILTEEEFQSRVKETLPYIGYTVSTLPTGVIGDRAYVTDATAPTYLGTLTGSGAVVCPVFHNGTAWVSV